MGPLAVSLKNFVALSVLSGCAVVFSAAAADPAAGGSVAAGHAAPSPAIQERMTQFQLAVGTYRATAVLLNAELDQIPNHFSKSEQSRVCYTALLPAIESFNTDSKSVKTVFSSGHSCNESSPDACWLPVFDRADLTVEKVTSRAQQLRAELEQCRRAGA